MKHLAIIQSEFVKLSVDFSSDEAMIEYLKRHPKSDRRKHKVIKEQQINPSDYWGRDKNELKFLTDHDARLALNSLNENKDTKDLVKRKENNSKVLYLTNDATRRKALEHLLSKKLHQMLIKQKE
jgi:hypothetical protein